MISTEWFILAKVCTRIFHLLGPPLVDMSARSLDKKLPIYSFFYKPINMEEGFFPTSLGQSRDNCFSSFHSCMESPEKDVPHSDCGGSDVATTKVVYRPRFFHSKRESSLQHGTI